MIFDDMIIQHAHTRSQRGDDDDESPPAALPKKAAGRGRAKPRVDSDGEEYDGSSSVATASGTNLERCMQIQSYHIAAFKLTTDECCYVKDVCQYLFAS